MLSNRAAAQGNTPVHGRIADTTGSRQDLSAASVSILKARDSASVAFTLTDKQGVFSVSGLPPGSYRLQISFLGYETITRRFSLAAPGEGYDFGLVYLQKKSDLLKEVVVERPPMQLKKDTVEYSAGSFATKPNAVAEDLLKKMPGIQVDKSGAITAHGETVTRVLVNGKKFFSDDPKLATRNLPPDVIDKIQVFDDLSDQSKFTGFDDGNRVKTINIVTRRDKQQGYFGKMVAGAGSSEDYDASVNMHRFKGSQQISVLGQANDINKQNFTIQDILGSSGGGGGRRGGNVNSGGSTTSSPGITTVWAGGANYRDAWGKNTDAYGSYFFNSQHVSTTSSASTRNISPEDTVYPNSQSQSASIQRTRNHRVNFNLEHRFDTSNSLIFRPNITFQTTKPVTSSSTLQYLNNGDTLTQSSTRGNSSNSGYSVSGANLQLRHKFSKAYRTVSLDLNSSANANNGDGYNYTVNHKYVYHQADTLNQYYTDSLHSVTLSPTLSYTEPVGKNQILELNYNYTYTHYTSANSTYGYDAVSKVYSAFDSLFSNSYKFTSNANRFTLNYRIQNSVYNLSVGTGVQLTHFSSFNTTKNILVSPNTYVNLTPTVNFRYAFTKTSNLRVNYSGRTGTPSAAQLQPLVTTSDNLNFQVGNPHLKPQFTHSLRVLYANFDPVTQHVMFATVNASTIVNDIQSAVIQNPGGGRTSTYVNLNGTYNVNGFFNYGFALKKPKSNLNFITNFNYSQSQTLTGDSLQNVKNQLNHTYTRNTSMGETLSWTTNLKKHFDMNISAPFTYYIVSNASSPLHYFTQAVSTELTAYTTTGWLIAASFDYTYYGGNRGPSSATASVPIFSPSIAKQLFKKKDGELRLSCFDLFNKNQVISTSSLNNQVTNSQTNLLGRYLMLTFTFNLNNFAGSQQQRMPGMFNNFRRGPGGEGPPRG